MFCHCKSNMNQQKGLCFVYICSKYAKVIQDSRIYFEARWRQLFEVNDAVSGGVILSILTARMPV